MICFPNCKINLGLYITRRRDDGYHDLETVFCPVKLNDVLEAVPAAAPAVAGAMHISGLPVKGNERDNLVWKAWELLNANHPGMMQPVDIYLHKVIPMGAGLGGGSADAAFMLLLLNDMFSLGLTKEQLADYALQLGSDCPFFVYNKPQFATGRGEVMTSIAIDLSAYTIQLICPDVHVSTGAAFSAITPRPAGFDLRLLHELPVADWQGNISNDFEAPVFKQHPALASIKQQLYLGGALYASMSGSGSAIYGIFEKGKKAEVTADVPFTEVVTDALT